VIRYFLKNAAFVFVLMLFIAISATHSVPFSGRGLSLLVGFPMVVAGVVTITHPHRWVDSPRRRRSTARAKFHWSKQIATTTNPSCPKCGAQLRVRVAQRGGYRGQPFLGCSRYPECDGLRPIAEAKNGRALHDG
jgi:hypothetical protein